MGLLFDSQDDKLVKPNIKQNEIIHIYILYACSLSLPREIYSSFKAEMQCYLLGVTFSTLWRQNELLLPPRFNTTGIIFITLHHE